MRERIASQQSRSDANLEDEDDAKANERRKQLAAESEVRRATEAKQLARENAVAARRRAEAGTRTDDDIMDERAGRARLELAAASKARRAAEAKALERANAELAARRREINQRTDDDIMDEESGRMRLKLAAESKARREAEAVKLAAKNAELQRRLSMVRSRTNDGDGGDGPTGSLDADMPPLHKASGLAYATFLRFQYNESNRMAADKVRGLKVEIDGLKTQQALEWMEHGRQRVKERQKREKETRKAISRMQKANREKVVHIRSEEAAWEELRIQRKEEHQREGRARVLEASALDARLDAQEEAVDAREREEFSRKRKEIAEAAAEVRQTVLLDKQRQVSAGAAARSASLTARSASLDVTSRMGEAKREESRQWYQQKQQQEEDYLQRARQNRSRAHEWRLSARRSLRAAWKVKVKAAVKERGNDHLVADAKRSIRQANRKEVQAIYSQRFADRAMEGIYLNSPMARLAGSLSSSRASTTRTSSSRFDGSVALAGGKAEQTAATICAGAGTSAPASPAAGTSAVADVAVSPLSTPTPSCPSSPLPLSSSPAKAKAAKQGAVEV